MHEIDLEKQAVNDGDESTSPGGTTVVGDLHEPLSPSKPGIRRSITDYLRKVSPPEKFPEPSQPEAPYDEVQRIKRIDNHPKGYPQLAALLNTDENFLMCRRFGFLQQRVLLYRQDELRDLEDQLIRLDDEDREENPKALQSRKLDDAREGSYRRGLIQLIDDKLEEYAKTIQRIRYFSTSKSANSRNHNSVSNWLYNKAPLSREETEFIHHKSDLIMLSDIEETGWFDGFVEDILSKVPNRFTRLLFSTREQRHTTDDVHVHLYSKERIGILVRVVICCLAVVTLMAPVVVLLLVDSTSSIKIMVIVLSTMLFAVILSVFTKARRHEVFAATAA